MKLFIVALVLVVSAVAEHTEEELKAWQSFKLSNGKMFLSVNKEKERMNNYLENRATVQDINEKFLAGELSFTAAEYAYHDLSTNEFLAKYTGAVPENVTDVKIAPAARTTPPACLDLRTRGEVNAVRNQGGCGSCWTFSATASTESCYFRKNKQAVDLSEQQLVECVYARSGCNGGWMSSAFDWIKANGGQAKECEVPYTGVYTAQCKKPAGTFNANGWLQVKGDNTAIKSAIDTYGVLAIAVDASQWGSYRGGLFYQQTIKNAVNHAVNLVGYGKDEHGQEFWNVRNSWGPGWGENGHIRLRMVDGKYNTFYPEHTFAVQC